ncbi:uncharacterized protein LOC125521342 [Triticum urartu]|uniref:uncharacterized protein LOC125521342 n=1 Tax=Triticum urartu TaxID=4572 RepID=UPI00204447DB|nr:uncharacterized protein LOC125521342 [Triticum urartu]
MSVYFAVVRLVVFNHHSELYSSTTNGSSNLPSFHRHRHRPEPPLSSPPRARFAHLQGFDSETAADVRVFDYIEDDPSFLPEQPGDGVQEPDATIEDDSYYTGGAYYYVQAADDDQE